MKLALCPECSDVFKLHYEMRSCKCGKIKGRYINEVEAEVSKEAISIALGNGALVKAWHEMLAHQQKTNDTADRDEYIQQGNGNIVYAWIRPNTGPGNPHTKLIEE